MQGQERYADSFQAMQSDRVVAKQRPDAVLEPVDVDALEAQNTIEQVKSAARVKAAILQMEAFFGYKENRHE